MARDSIPWQFDELAHAGPEHLDPEYVAAVFTRNPLHHLPDFWKAASLQRIAQLLKPGGVLRVRDIVYSFDPSETAATVNAWLASAPADPTMGWTADQLAEHIREEHSTYSWLIEPMLERVGFEISDRWVSPNRMFAAYTCIRRQPASAGTERAGSVAISRLVDNRRSGVLVAVAPWMAWREASLSASTIRAAASAAAILTAGADELLSAALSDGGSRGDTSVCITRAAGRPPGNARRLSAAARSARSKCIPTAGHVEVVSLGVVDEQVVPVLRVEDAARAVAWYARLGFRKEWEHQFEPGFPWFVSVARGSVRLYLSEHTGDARPDTLIHLYVTDIDAVSHEFGVPVDEEGLAGRQCDISDPDGNRLRIATPRG